MADEHLAFENTLKVLTSFMMGAGAVVMVMYWYVMDVSRDKSKAGVAARLKAKAKEGKKAKPSLLESMRILSKSTWLECIAVMVVSYGLTMEFTEIIWKATVKMAYPNKQDYMEFMGNYSTVVRAHTWNAGGWSGLGVGQVGLQIGGVGVAYGCRQNGCHGEERSTD